MFHKQLDDMARCLAFPSPCVMRTGQGRSLGSRFTFHHHPSRATDRTQGRLFRLKCFAQIRSLKYGDNFRYQVFFIKLHFEHMLLMMTQHMEVCWNFSQAWKKRRRERKERRGSHKPFLILTNNLDGNSHQTPTSSF